MRQNGDKKDSKSTSGILLKINDCPILWKSKKQDSVALSSCEAEFIATALAAQESVFVKNICLDLNFNTEIILFNDNKSSIQIIKNPKSSQRTKHISVKYNFIRDMIESKIIQLNYLSGSEIPADIFTKPLGKVKFSEIAKSLNLIKNQSQVEVLEDET